MALVGLRPEYTLPKPGQRPWGTLVATIPQAITPGDRVWDGVSIVGQACGDVLRLNTSCEPLTGDSMDTDEAYGDVFVFNPVVVYVNKVCGILSGLDVGADADQRLAMSISKQIAAELYLGDTTLNPAITRNPTIIPVVDDVGLPICQALELLEENLADYSGNLEMFIHVSPAALQLLASEGCIELEDGIYRTHTGHIVIGDAGYDGSAPVDDDGVLVGAALAAGEEFLYATGPIAWGLGPQTTTVFDTGSSSARTNRIQGNAQQLALAVFDPWCVHLAVRAKICGDC